MLKCTARTVCSTALLFYSCHCNPFWLLGIFLSKLTDQLHPAPTAWSAEPVSKSLRDPHWSLRVQVGYDVGDHPELLLAAAGRHNGAAADEAGVKDDMLARLRTLKR